MEFFDNIIKDIVSCFSYRKTSIIKLNECCTCYNKITLKEGVLYCNKEYCLDCYDKKKENLNEYYVI